MRLRPRLLALPILCWSVLWGAALPATGCYYDLAPVDVVADQGVPDLAQDLAAYDANGDALVCPNGAAPFHAGELTEAPVDRWGAAPIAPIASDPTTTASLDTGRVVAGTSSLLLSTSNGSAGLFYPATRDADYDMTRYLYVSYSITADDSAPTNDPGWRGSQPRLLLVNDDGSYFEYVPATNRLPRAPGDFARITVPLAGGSGWSRNRVGEPNLQHVRYLAMTFDSWGAGFSVWIDDLQIGPARFLDCSN